MKSEQLFIVGAPNCGKTTLFNALTGKNERVGNWHGVTTNAVSACLKIKDLNVTITDLPGGYFDKGFTLESQKFKSILKSDSKVLFLIEAQNLPFALADLKKLANVTNNVIIVINMYEELKSKGGSIDVCALNKLLNCKCIIAECNKSDGVNAVKRLIADFLNKSEYLLNKFFIADDVLLKAFRQPLKKGICKLDIFLLDYFRFTLVIAVSFFIVFYLAFGKFGIASAVCFLLEKILQYAVYQPIAWLFGKFCSPFLLGFVLEGVIGGFISVLSFLPRIAVMVLFNSVLEESGVLARVAFMLDGFLSRIGLSGRAILCLLCGYGCTVVAVSCTGALENDKIKCRAIKAFPFLSCTAKTPVYLYLLYSFGSKISFLFICAIFLAGFILSALTCLVDFKLSGQKKQNLIIEFPPYRVPKLKNTFKTLQKFTKEFIIKLGAIVTIVTAFLYVFRSVSKDFVFLPKDKANQSLLYLMCEKLTFIFKPIGITDGCFVLSAISGIFAKESIVSTLSLFNFNPLSLKQTVAYLLFCYAYPPCFSALYAIYKQAGKLFTLKLILKQTLASLLLAYSVCDLRYAILLLLFIAIPALKKIKMIKRGLV